MFSGIVAGVGEVLFVHDQDAIRSLIVKLPKETEKNLEIGASIAVNGVCLTATKIEKQEVSFDVLSETCQKTNLGSIKKGEKINIERSLCLGGEIGGHLLSGHISSTCEIANIERKGANTIWTIECSFLWRKYLFPKGFVALDGASLTLVDVSENGFFTVHLIPETLSSTTFSNKKVGDSLNLEIEAQTQATVDTIERILEKRDLFVV